MKNGRLILLITQLLMMSVLLISLWLNGIHLKADLLSALPDSEFPEPVMAAEKEIFLQASNRLVLSFSGAEKELAYDEALKLVQKNGWTAQIPQQKMLANLAEYYQGFSGKLLTDNYVEVIQSHQRFEQYFLSQVSMLSSPWISQTINQDPSLATANYLEALLGKQSSLVVDGGRFIAINAPAKPILLFISLKEHAQEAQSVDFSIAIAQEINGLISRLGNEYPKVKVNSSGMIMHTAENATNAIWEINVFGSVSLFATLLVVIWALRSCAPILWIVLTVGNAFVFGFSVLAWVFDTVHFITLVFGVTLIGLGADYCLHVLINRYSTERTLVGKTVFFAFMTTFLCYCLLFFTPLLILKQVAVFVSSGLFAAFVMSFWIEKTNIFPSINQTIRPRNVLKIQNVLTSTSRFTVFCSCLILVFMVVKTPTFDDSVAKLNASSASLNSSQALHHQLLEQQGKKRVFLYHESVQQLLQNEEALADILIKQFPDIQLTKLSDWVPSKQRQKHNEGTFSKAIEQGVFSSLVELTTSFEMKNAHQMVTLEDFVAHHGSHYISHLYVDVGSFHVSVMEVNNISLAQLTPIITMMNNAVIFDKQSSLTQILTSFRVQLTYWLYGAIALISLLLWIRFDWMTMVKSLFVISTCISGALIASSLYQEALNIFNLLSAILVIGLAVDYLVFYREHPKTNANTLAITLSAVSSLFVFGMLTFSKTPAIYSFGITVTAGLLLVYLLAPLVIKEENEQRNV